MQGMEILMEDQHIKQIRRFYRREFIIFIAIVVGFSLFSLRNRDSWITLNFGDDSMTLTGPDDAPFVVEISYQDILSVQKVTSLDLGENLTGIDTEKCLFGTWKNDSYGEYTLCASPSVSDYIVLETDCGITVFNYESEDMTEHLYTALAELIDEQQ